MASAGATDSVKSRLTAMCWGLGALDPKLCARVGDELCEMAGLDKFADPKANYVPFASWMQPFMHLLQDATQLGAVRASFNIGQDEENAERDLKRRQETYAREIGQSYSTVRRINGDAIARILAPKIEADIASAKSLDLETGPPAKDAPEADAPLPLDDPPAATGATAATPLPVEPGSSAGSPITASMPQVWIQPRHAAPQRRNKARRRGLSTAILVALVVSAIAAFVIHPRLGNFLHPSAKGSPSASSSNNELDTVLAQITLTNGGTVATTYKGPGDSNPVVDHLQRNSTVLLRCLVRGQTRPTQRGPVNTWYVTVGHGVVAAADTSFWQVDKVTPRCPWNEFGPRTFPAAWIGAAGLAPRAGPKRDAPAVGPSIPEGQLVDVDCEMHSDLMPSPAPGIPPNDLWDRLADGRYVPNISLDTQLDMPTPGLLPCT